MQDEGRYGSCDLGGRVAARRHELGLTRSELAARAGMAVTYVAYLESYPATVSGECLMRLADALDTTPQLLLCANHAAVPEPACAQRPGTNLTR